MSATANGVRHRTAVQRAAQIARARVVRLDVPQSAPGLAGSRGRPARPDGATAARRRARSEALARLPGAAGRELRGNSATLILRSPTIGETGLLYTWGGSAEVISQYSSRYFATDPFVQLPDKQVMTLHDFVPPAQLERSAFFTDYPRALGTRSTTSASTCATRVAITRACA
jgi:hypothetical protein